MPYRYVVADVFTRHAYGGNPLAVVLDAQGLDTAQMQRIAREFTSPRPASCCRRAIRRTRPKCGSSRPIGKCLSPGIPMSARRWCWRASWRHRDVPAGRVRVRRGGRTGADRAAARRGGRERRRVAAPQPLSRRALAPVDAVARALRLAPGDIETAEHAPQVVSVGLTFLVVQLASRVALRRASPDPAGYAGCCRWTTRVPSMPYDRHGGGHGQGPTDIQARMFTGRMTEDPHRQRHRSSGAARGIAGRGDHAATAGGQGVDMGRASLLHAHAAVRQDGVWAGVAGNAVVVMEGTLAAPAAS